MNRIAPRTGRRESSIWDLGTRLFHWGLVASVAAAAATGFLAPESWTDIHALIGHGIIGLVAFRLVWGVVGPRYSRFRSFLFGPAETLRFLRGLAAGRPARHAGHNPAGAWMIFALLATLAGLAVSGLIVWGGEEKQGVLAAAASYRLARRVGDLHEGLAILLLFLIAGHVLGVLVESRLGAENLVRTMITGVKRLPLADLPTGVTPGRTAVGLVLLAGLAGASPLALPSVGGGAPATALPRSVAGTAYQRECGDCHHAFHPSLLPARTWSAVMTGLPDHFGEDASLDERTTEELRRYLAANSAEHWDTKGAHLFRAAAAADPLRITATDAWRRIHRDIAADRFTNPKIGGRTNCGACHRDAAAGRFADSQIHIPETQR